MKRSVLRLAQWMSFALIIHLSTHVDVQAQVTTKPLVIGESLQIQSKHLAETRRINVFLPDAYANDPQTSYPVIFMLDGGVAEDFLHIAGLTHISIANGTIRPFILVGVENTVRRRDLTSTSANALDQRDIPNAGGSSIFRRFLVEELIPEINQRYRVTPERVLLGESLAGLFTLETLLKTPDAFQTYIALDPSLWWNDEKLTADFSVQLKAQPSLAKKLYVASSGQAGMEKVIQHFADVLNQTKPEGLQWKYEKYRDETHATIYHPAALKAFRHLLAPPPMKK